MSASRRWDCQTDGSLQSPDVGEMTSSEVVCQPLAPCLPPPSLVAPGHSCSCNLTELTGSPEICQEGQLCNNTCITPVCTEVDVDTDSVEVTELFMIENATSQGAILRFSCKEEAAVFNVGSGLTRILASCNRR